MFYCSLALTQYYKVGLRLTVFAQLNRILDTHPGWEMLKRVQAPIEQVREVADAMAVRRADRRHCNEMAIEPFDSVLLREDACLPYCVVVLLHRDSPLTSVEQGLRNGHDGTGQCRMLVASMTWSRLKTVLI
ncbi:hypothetical protein GGP77_003595 [Salinibacter ruber]|nr:hypothetical protein [Salinibacter ruber]MCS4116260.1 hypothetical protein [Salinibacter ruber]MCS4149504.1 hypothetical protein [Salinibacter ruber]MCS4156057.1 hypothetical protein [Salinibacter ruber]MCS4181989.1 hypothetical protein [Salinibacter ruber]